MPKRSTGCEECRRRKVRCDGSKPECERCVLYGVRCPGYRKDPQVGARWVIHVADQHPVLQGRQNSSAASARSSSVRSSPSATGGDWAGVGGGVEDFSSYGGGFWNYEESDTTSDGVIIVRSHEEATVRPWHRRLESIGEAFDSQELLPGISSGRISLRHLFRLQLLSAFLDVRFPTPGDKAVAKSSYVAALPSMDLSSPLLQAAVDALCLAGLGSAHADRNEVQESQFRYGRALYLLAREVSHPPSRVERRRPVVTTMMILCLCEQFDSLSLGAVGAHGWAAHLNGAQQYLKACGPSAISTPFDWLLFHNLRLSVLFLGCAERKAVVFADPAWLKLTESRKPDGSVALYDLSNLAMLVPTLLERTDRLLDSTLRNTYWTLALQRLCKDMARMRDQFDDWFRLVHPTGPGYEIVNVEDLDSFPCADRTFKTVFSWTGIRGVRQNTMYWIFSLIIDCTALRLMHFLPGTTNVWPWDEDAVQRDAFVMATNLCRTVPYCATSTLSDIKELSRWYLDFAQNYFAEAGDCEQEQNWCRSIRVMSAQIASQSSKTSPKKLWNLGRIAPYAVAPARYKARDLRLGILEPEIEKHPCVDWSLNLHNSATFVADLRPDRVAFGAATEMNLMYDLSSPSDTFTSVPAAHIGTYAPELMDTGIQRQLAPYPWDDTPSPISPEAETSHEARSSV